ncbi:MAG TPA: BrnA antitoxin family protein [Devosia sp.]|jgi:uncharacterized protein (DUF4415 family)|uniref:BrnA antitoxin family protein n=1 Tax=Devosia sp. TaxID=1871048 RepID=UPI002DDD23E4|nr:BrnA antitoxin family protein [Devosia sp.]HEV2514165.1 BrnA antitoxin family protein [Devosia sp.]
MSKPKSRHLLTDAEEAEVQRMIASDPDNPEATDTQIAQAKPFADAFPALAEAIKRGRGRPRLENAKEAVTLRLDPDVVARFKARGGDWRTRMAEVIKAAS